MQKKIEKRLYNLKETGLVIGRTEWGVRELVYKGLLPVVRADRRIFVDIKDIEEFIEKFKSRETD